MKQNNKNFKPSRSKPSRSKKPRSKKTRSKKPRSKKTRSKKPRSKKPRSKKVRSKKVRSKKPRSKKVRSKKVSSKKSKKKYKEDPPVPLPKFLKKYEKMKNESKISIKKYISTLENILKKHSNVKEFFYNTDVYFDELERLYNNSEIDNDTYFDAMKRFVKL
jgi:hypothetical protein